jgi:hypothetical protein
LYSVPVTTERNVCCLHSLNLFFWYPLFVSMNHRCGCYCMAVKFTIAFPINVFNMYSGSLYEPCTFTCKAKWVRLKFVQLLVLACTEHWFLCRQDNLTNTQSARRCHLRLCVWPLLMCLLGSRGLASLPWAWLIIQCA